VVLSAVKQNALALQSTAMVLQKDRDFMIQAIKTNRDSIPHGVTIFHADREFWIKLLKSFPDGVALFVEFYGEGPLQKDSVLMHELTKKDWRAFQIASPELRSQEPLQLEAVCQCWEAVRWANKVEQKVMLECVRQEWKAIEVFLQKVDGPRDSGHIGDEERKELATCNPHIVRAKELADHTVTVLAAVKQKGPVLKFASERLRADFPVAQAAIRENWKALEFASDEIRGDKPLVMETLKQCGLALQFATETLKRDHQVCIEAILRHRKSLPFISKALYTDELFWTKVCGRFPDGWQMALKMVM